MKPACKTTCLLNLMMTITLVGIFSGCQTVGPGAATGGAFGTLAGGLTGAAIGSKEGKSPEGALIGALAGGTLGSVAGNAIDREVERQRFDTQQAIQQRRLAAVSLDQIIQMSQSGLASDVIARQIQNQGVVRRPTIDDLILLKNNGVDDIVIQSFQNSAVGGAVATVPAGRPVQIVRQPYYYENCAPAPYPYDFRYYKRRGCRPRAGFSVRF